MPLPRSWLFGLTTALLMAGGCLVGALLAEAAYRAYLVKKHPARFKPAATEISFGVSSVSQWEFDERFGYVYPAGRVVDRAAVIDGRVRKCERSTPVNPYGNIDVVSGNWRSAKLRVAVFGDSFTAYRQAGVTWPNLLHKALSEKLGHPVAVLNFGRDGYGLLQMLDLAAPMAEKWKPDVVVIAFITDDLTRGRFWRTVVGEGDAQRVVTTLDPVRNPPEARAADTELLMASATYEWCTAMAASGQSDAVLERLIEKQRLMRQRVQGPLASAWDAQRSYLFNRLWRRDPFWHLTQQLRPPQNPRHSYASFAEDARTLENTRALKSSGAKLVLFHLAYYPELKAGKEYLLSARDKTLLESLEPASGVKVLRTTDHVATPVERPERLTVTPEDYHPSLAGMEFYAQAVASALFRESTVGKAPGAGR